MKQLYLFITTWRNTQMTKVIRRPQIVEKTGQSYSTLNKLEQQGLFPKRRCISAKCVGWLEHEVDEYLNSLPTGKGKPPSSSL